MRLILAALVVLLASTAMGQSSTIEQRNAWRAKAAELELTAEGLRHAAECTMLPFPAGWTWRKEVTPEAYPATPLTNALVAIKIDADAHIAANALANGHDVLFTDPTDGTTVLPSYRIDYSGGTWRGYVLVPTYSTGYKPLVNYGNAGAADQSSVTALTDGGLLHWLNFSSGDTSQLVDVISGATAASVGTIATQAGPVWDAWDMANDASVTFGAGELQPAAPYTRVARVKATQFQTTYPANYGGTRAPRLLMAAFTWTAAITGGPGTNALVNVPLSSGQFQTISMNCPAGDPGQGSIYSNGGLVSGAVATSPGYAGVLSIGGSARIADIAEYAYFSGEKSADWHAWWHANTGAVSLSAEEQAEQPPALAISGICPAVRTRTHGAAVSARTHEAGISTKHFKAAIRTGCH